MAADAEDKGCDVVLSALIRARDKIDCPLLLSCLVFLRQIGDDGAVRCGRAERLAELATRQALPAVVTLAGVSVCGGMITRGRAAEAVVATTSAAVHTAP